MSTNHLSRVSITENEKAKIKRPPKVGQQLEKAAFEQQSANEYVKRRKIISDDRSEYEVARVTVKEDTLQVEAKDVVGIVKLTPSLQLQITPKIGWDEVLEMLLTVLEQRDRSIEYQGVPIEDFLKDDISIEDIFLITAVNFLESLVPLHEHGLIRELYTERNNAIASSGRIDIKRSLLNHHKGIPKQHYIEKKVEYSVPVHELIHAAGIQLIRLFDQHSEQYEHEGYYQVFSAVDREVQYLENLGITSSFDSLPEYRAVSVTDLPPQREYYRRAIDVSKMILSSATGKALVNGQHELTMDYILNMNELFQEYTHSVIENVTAELLEKSPHRQTEIEVRDEPRISAFENEATSHHRPDHLIQREGETIAVLDTKYYAEGIDPSLQTDARTRMFSYGFLTNSKYLAFLTPLSETHTRTVATQDATLSVVSATQDSYDFSTTAYEEAIKQYLKDIFADELSDFVSDKIQNDKTGEKNEFEQNQRADVDRDEQEVEERLEDYTNSDLDLEDVSQMIESDDVSVCYPDVGADTANNIQRILSKLRLENNIKNIALLISQETIKQANTVQCYNSTRGQLKARYRYKIKDMIKNRKDCNFCLPILISTQSKETLIFYFISQSGREIKHVDKLSLPLR